MFIKNQKINLFIKSISALLIFFHLNLIWAQNVIANNSFERAPNGVSVQQIAAPNQNGISHNVLNTFNVEQKGLVINNQNENKISQLAAMVGPNPNLIKRESAKLIINEVNGTQKSQLDGFTEVLGPKTEYILANPNGITCNGCGFINMSRVTLATGNTNWQRDKFLGLNVNSGAVDFTGSGSNFEQLDAIDIVTRKTKIDAPLIAKKLNFFLGVNDFDFAKHDIATSKTSKIIKKDTDKPKYSFDATSLGSMSVGSIYITSTEIGTGVNMNADLASNAGEIIIKNKGEIKLNNITKSKTYIKIDSNNNIPNDLLNKITTKEIYADNFILISSETAIDIEKRIEALNVKLSGIDEIKVISGIAIEDFNIKSDGKVNLENVVSKNLNITSNTNYNFDIEKDGGVDIKNITSNNLKIENKKTVVLDKIKSEIININAQSVKTKDVSKQNENSQNEYSIEANNFSISAFLPVTLSNLNIHEKLDIELIGIRKNENNIELSKIIAKNIEINTNLTPTYNSSMDEGKVNLESIYVNGELKIETDNIINFSNKNKNNQIDSLYLDTTNDINFNKTAVKNNINIKKANNINFNDILEASEIKILKSNIVNIENLIKTNNLDVTSKTINFNGNLNTNSEISGVIIKKLNLVADYIIFGKQINSGNNNVGGGANAGNNNAGGGSNTGNNNAGGGTNTNYFGVSSDATDNFNIISDYININAQNKLTFNDAKLLSNGIFTINTGELFFASSTQDKTSNATLQSVLDFTIDAKKFDSLPKNAKIYAGSKDNSKSTAEFRITTASEKFENNGYICADNTLTFYGKAEKSTLENKKLILSNGDLNLYFNEIYNKDSENIGNNSKTKFVGAYLITINNFNSNFTAVIKAQKNLTIAKNNSDKANLIQNNSGYIGSDNGDVNLYAIDVINQRTNAGYKQGHDPESINFKSKAEIENLFAPYLDGGECRGPCNVPPIENKMVIDLEFNDDLGYPALIYARENIKIEATNFKNIASTITAKNIDLFKTSNVYNENLVRAKLSITREMVTKYDHRYCKNFTIFGACQWGYQDIHKLAWTNAGADQNGIIQVGELEQTTLNAYIKASKVIDGGSTYARLFFNGLSSAIFSNIIKESEGAKLNQIENNIATKFAQSIDKENKNKSTYTLEEINSKKFTVQLDDNYFKEISNNPLLKLSTVNGYPRIENEPFYKNGELFLDSELFKILSSGIGLTDLQNTQRLGNAYYDTLLIQTQLLNILHKSVIDDELNLNGQIQKLVENSAEFAMETKLSPGVALTSDMISNLKKDIVWYEKTKVEGKEVLVPRVYFSKNSIDRINLDANKNISAQEVRLKFSEVINNGGVIHGSLVTLIETTKGDLINNLGTISGGGSVSLKSAGRIINRAGDIFGASVALSAVQDIRNEAILYWEKNEINNKKQNVFQGNISATDSLVIHTDSSYVNIASNLSSGGDAKITARDNIIFKGVSLESKSNSVNGNTNEENDSLQYMGSNLNINGRLSAKTDNGSFDIIGSEVAVGSVDLDIKKGINIESVYDVYNSKTSNTDTSTNNEKSSTGVGGKQTKTTTTTNTGVSTGKVHASNFNILDNDKTSTIKSDGTMSLIGSNFSSLGNVDIDVGDFIAKGMADTQENWSHTDVLSTEIKTDLMGVSVSQTNTSSDTSEKKSFSECKENCENALKYNKANIDIGGNLKIKSKNNITATGTNFNIEKDVSLDAANDLSIKADNVEENSNKDSKSSTNSIGISTASDVTLTHSENQSNEAGNKKNGISSSIKSKSGNVSLKAGHDLNIIGSDVEAVVGGVLLDGKNKVNIGAFEQTEDFSKEEKGFSASVSTNILQNATGVANFKIDLGVQGSKEKSNSINNLQSSIKSGKFLNIKSDGDLNIKGAQVKGKDLDIDIKGNLNLESVEDKKSSSSSSMNANISVGVGAQIGFSASVDLASKDSKSSKVNSISSLLGTESVKIKVGGDVNVTGATIANQKADGSDGGNLQMEIGGKITSKEIQGYDRASESKFVAGGGMSDVKKINTLANLSLGGGNKLDSIDTTTRSTIGLGKIVAKGGGGESLNRDISKQQVVTNEVHTDNIKVLDATPVLGVVHAITAISEANKDIKSAKAEATSDQNNNFGPTAKNVNPLTSNLKGSIINNTNKIITNTSSILNNTATIIDNLGKSNTNLTNAMRTGAKNISAVAVASSFVNNTYNAIDKLSSKKKDENEHLKNSDVENIKKGFTNLDVRNIKSTLNGLENLTQHVSVLSKDASEITGLLGNNSLSNNFSKLSENLDAGKAFLEKADVPSYLANVAKKEINKLAENPAFSKLLDLDLNYSKNKKAEEDGDKSKKEKLLLKDALTGQIDDWNVKTNKFINDTALKTQNYLKFGYFQNDTDLEKTLRNKLSNSENKLGPLEKGSKLVNNVLTAKEKEFLKAKTDEKKALITPGSNGMGLIQNKNNEYLVGTVLDALKVARDLLTTDPERFANLDPSLQKYIKKTVANSTNENGEVNIDKVNKELLKLAKSTPSEMCNFISYMNSVNAAGGDVGNLNEAYMDAVLSGQIGFTSKNNLAYGKASGKWREENNMQQVYGSTKDKENNESLSIESLFSKLKGDNKPKETITNFEDNPQKLMNILNSSSKSVAVVELTRGHFINVIRDENNKWINWDHTSTAKDRRGAEVDPKTIRKVIIFK